MKRLVDALAARRWIAWTFLVLMTAPAVFGVSKLEFSHEAQVQFDRNAAATRRLEELSAAFQLDAPTAVLVVQADELFSRRSLSRLRTLVGEVGRLENVERVESLLDVPRFERPEFLADRPVLGWIASLVPRPLVPPASADEETLAEARQAALQHPLVSGSLLSEDAQTTLVTAHLATGPTIDEVRPVVHRVQEIACWLRKSWGE